MYLGFCYCKIIKYREFCLKQIFNLRYKKPESEHFDFLENFLICGFEQLQERFDEIEEAKAELIKLENSRKSLVKQEKENKTPTKRRRTSRRSSPPFRSSAQFEVVRKYHTRSRQKKIDDPFADLTDSDDENSKSCTNSIKVMFPFARPIQRDIDLMRLESDDEEWCNNNYDFDKYGKRKEKRSRVGQNRNHYDPSTIPSPDEITQRMLDNVAERATGKIYDQAKGTSCHQCRQKTKDTKTVCRSGECVGVRGQFCGPCLRGRYGENALEALKDPVS